MPEKSFPYDPGSWIGIHLGMRLGARGGQSYDPEALIFGSEQTDSELIQHLEDSIRELPTYRDDPRSHRLYDLYSNMTSWTLKRALTRLIHKSLDNREERMNGSLPYYNAPGRDVVSPIAASREDPIPVCRPRENLIPNIPREVDSQPSIQSEFFNRAES